MKKKTVTEYTSDNIDNIKKNKKWLIVPAIENTELLEFMVKNKIYDHNELKDMLIIAEERGLSDAVGFLKTIIKPEDIKSSRNRRAATITSLKKEWNFKENKNGTMTINGYTGFRLNIVVPAMVGTKEVTEIEDTYDSCYEHYWDVRNARSKITSVIIPDGVIKIGHGAFARYESLKEVSIPDSVAYIDEYAFGECTSLESIVIPKGVKEISWHAFHNCVNLKEVFFLGKPQLSRSAFSGCKSFADETGLIIIDDCLYACLRPAKEIIIPDKVKKITECAFSGAERLNSVIINNSIKSFNFNIFAGCKGLRKLVIPDSVVSIEDSGNNMLSRKLELYVKQGSYAEQFAKEHGYNIVLM